MSRTLQIAPKLTVQQRMAHLLRVGSMPAECIAEEIDSTAETVCRTARRNKNKFVVLEGGKIGLLSH